ncbi:DUF3040 domain-containing protein [Smaragdicoccus niigatensis]|uniref:DUF3040 domain-containing protein n=1 Tax=Smaragdicoccus niigatensis TaxID=359359 RepID=UPI0003814EC3|nr:DUF3040 domain-containing protein [Smaragdicoccus niigatensis]
MPLSEHEQRMLEQIESALYAEDPKFASTVRTGHVRGVSNRRRTQAAALFALGLVMLFAGMFLFMVKVGIISLAVSLAGFGLMFGAGVMLLRGSPVKAVPDGRSSASGPARAAGPHGSSRPRQTRRQAGFSARMEDRFRRRFDQP